MNEQWEQESQAVRAEVAALQQHIRALAAQLANANAPARWGIAKSLKVLLPIGMLLTAGGALYGQGAMDALFIDQNGKVGIGTPMPKAMLDVAGNVNIAGPLTAESLSATKGAAVKAPVKIETTDGRGVSLDIGGEADNANLTSLQLKNGNTITEGNYRGNQITFGFNNTEAYRHAIQTRHNGKSQPGNAIDFFVWKYDKDNVDKAAIGGLHTLTLESGKVGIGTKAPQATLDVRGRALAQSLSFTDGNGASYTDNWIGMADNIEADKTKWLHIGGITDGGKRRLALYADTTRVSGNLDVVGAINGEKPPIVFELGQKEDTQKWYAVNKDIKDLCGDADGCTMKFFLRVNNSDEVRTISEQIYIEQPRKSNNKNPGLHGWCHQLGGGESQFVLQASNKNDVVPHPWNWIYVRNFSSPDVGRESNAFSVSLGDG